MLIKYNPIVFPSVCIKHCQSYWLNKYLPGYESWIVNRGSPALNVRHVRDLWGSSHATSSFQKPHSPSQKFLSKRQVKKPGQNLASKKHLVEASLLKPSLPSLYPLGPQVYFALGFKGEGSKISALNLGIWNFPGDFALNMFFLQENI